MILALKTDSPQAEIYLYSQEHNELDSLIWFAERRLANELLSKINNLLNKNNISLDKLKGIIVYTGDGSFTGLRIGTTVANTLAYSLDIPVVDGEGNDWREQGFAKLSKAQVGSYVVPKYSSEPNITKPKA